MSDRLIYEDRDQRIWITVEATDDAPQSERVERLGEVTDRERLAAAAAALAQLDEIAAPVLSVDVLDVLVDVRTALES